MFLTFNSSTDNHYFENLLLILTCFYFYLPTSTGVLFIIFIYIYCIHFIYVYYIHLKQKKGKKTVILRKTQTDLFCIDQIKLDELFSTRVISY